MTAVVKDFVQAVRVVKATGVSLNSGSTDVASITTLPSRFRVTGFTVHNTSTSLGASGATFGAYDTAAAGGNAIVSPTTLTGLTTAVKNVDMTIADADVITTGAIYLRNGTAHGSAATVDVYIQYMDLT